MRCGQLHSSRASPSSRLLPLTLTTALPQGRAASIIANRGGYRTDGMLIAEDSTMSCGESTTTMAVNSEGIHLLQPILCILLVVLLRMTEAAAGGCDTGSARSVCANASASARPRLRRAPQAPPRATEVFFFFFFFFFFLFFFCSFFQP